MAALPPLRPSAFARSRISSWRIDGTWRARGGAILIFVGVKTSRAHVDPDAFVQTAGPITGQAAGRKILQTFFLTATNPATMMGMLAIFGTMGAALELTTAPARAGMTVAGVMLGSLAWWIFLSGLVGFLRTRINGVWLDRINHWAGILIVALGFVFLFDALVPALGLKACPRPDGAATDGRSKRRAPASTAWSGRP